MFRLTCRWQFWLHCPKVSAKSPITFRSIYEKFERKIFQRKKVLKILLWIRLMQFWQSCKNCSATRWNIFLLIVWKWFEVQTSQEENEFTESVSLDPYVAVLTTLLKQLRQRRKNFQPIVRNWWEKGLFSKTASQKSPMVLSNAVLTALPKWSCRRSDFVLVKVQERQKNFSPEKIPHDVILDTWVQSH